MALARTLTTVKLRDSEAKAYAELWGQMVLQQHDGVLLLGALTEAIRKGYFRMGPKGELLLTEKGAWREVERIRKANGHAN
jgi:hypothetical protein